jgi:6-phosphogluconolactonase/glucosamine-6-phosphate isomerase/deaminase
VEIRVTVDAAAAATDAAQWVAGKLRNAVLRRGAALLAVSGGTTPAKMFAALSTLDVPWREVTVWQVDERIAPDGSAERNSPLLAIFEEIGAHVRLMPVVANDLELAARNYGAGLPERFDVVHLGLGDDGHTASWPPGDSVIDELSPVALSGEFHGTRRMTLTPPVVNGARNRLVLATGAAKAMPMRGWLLRNEALPIERLHRSGTVVVLDAAAASLLPLASPRHESR